MSLPIAQPPALDAPRLNLGWLLRLRYVAIAGQVIAIAVAQLAMRMSLALTELGGILALELCSNIVFGLWLKRQSRVSEAAVAALLGVDVLLLTWLLHLTGGPFNPFSSLYLVHVALAAVVLSPRLTAAVSVAALGAFGLLFVLPQSAEAALHHADQMRMHVRGMWLALAIAAAFIAYFVTRVTRDLRRRESELAETQALAQRNERLASLATLAAGAAHELSTPLGTIAVVAHELQQQLTREGAAGKLDDVQLIRREVERCREILNQMAVDAGQSTGEGFSLVTAQQLIDAALSGVDSARVQVQLDSAFDGERLFLPRRAVAQVLRAVLDNALDAVGEGEAVAIRGSVHAAHCEVLVIDCGPGMSAQVLQRAGEPFFTTKEPGQGMGLGLFLARAVLQRLQGDLKIESHTGQGTRVTLRLPRGNLSH